jgi:hypothetical protein
MQRLRELSRRVEAVYGEIADTFSKLLKLLYWKCYRWLCICLIMAKQNTP